MIGIISLYFQTNNYGGVLQSYATCMSVQKYTDCHAEQICFFAAKDKTTAFSVRSKVLSVLFKLRNIALYPKYFKALWNRISFNLKTLCWKKQLQRINAEKGKAFLFFSEQVVPHSTIIYGALSIASAANRYEAFIAGSDQVWNPSFYSPAYLLDFVPSDKIKISYAASIAKESLTEDEKEVFKKSLSDYKAVSVREAKAAELIKDFSPVEPQVVLDPTLLLDREDWDRVCASRVVNDDYLFCYFLGDNKRERRLALKFARQENLKVVSVPLTGAKIYSDLKYGDIVLLAASPEEFISLIKHARYIFTDSFHAVVFSKIYERQYFVFNRDKKESMNSRIYDITKLFHTQERFCDSKEKESLAYINSLPDIDYSVSNRDFDEMKEKSIQFLKTNLTV